MIQESLLGPYQKSQELATSDASIVRYGKLSCSQGTIRGSEDYWQWVNVARSGDLRHASYGHALQVNGELPAICGVYGLIKHNEPLHWKDLMNTLVREQRALLTVFIRLFQY